MTRKATRIVGIASMALFAVAAGSAVWLMPDSVVSMPSQALSNADGHDDAASQRVEIARAQPGSQAAGSGLPGGASSLNEAYRDWRVACAVQGTVKRCVLSQVQVQQNGQPVLAIELNAPAGDTVSGALLLPFGLAFDSGVILQIDDKPAIQPLRFRTCLPVGCVVPVAFDATTIAALRNGAALKIKATGDGGGAAPFSIPLHGLATALDRVGALTR